MDDVHHALFLYCNCENILNTAVVPTAGQNDSQLRAQVLHRLSSFPPRAGDGKPRKCGGVKDGGLSGRRWNLARGKKKEKWRAGGL